MRLDHILSLSPDKAAPLLLGSVLTSMVDGLETGGIITEVEAYMPENDPASHNAKGKTKTNTSLFSKKGTLYVHTMHGHYLLDIVTQNAEKPGSILIRAIRPSIGIDTMRKRRGVTDLNHLTDGPGKLCKALGIDKGQDGRNIFRDNLLTIKLFKQPISAAGISVSERIGISKNREAQLRFILLE